MNTVNIPRLDLGTYINGNAAERKQFSDATSEKSIDPLIGLRQMAIQVTKGVLPYPDLPRRWKVRMRSRSLIRFSPWPGNDATQLELAQLCLLRSLALQKQIHRSVRWRQRAVRPRTRAP